MENKRKVGDKVKIRNKEWYDSNERFGAVIDSNSTFMFSAAMCEYLEREATITDVCENHYKLDVDSGRWCWCDFMFEETLKEGDIVKVKSKEWYDLHKNGDIIGIVHTESGITFNPEDCDKVGEVIMVDSDGTVCVKFTDYSKWFAVDWVDKIGKEAVAKHKTSDIYRVPQEGDLVFVSDRYHSDSPREDWTIAKFVKARAKGIDTEEGIWTYCILEESFDYNCWESSKRCILKGEDNVLKRVECE